MKGSWCPWAGCVVHKGARADAGRGGGEHAGGVEVLGSAGFPVGLLKV